MSHRIAQYLYRSFALKDAACQALTGKAVKYAVEIDDGESGAFVTAKPKNPNPDQHNTIK